jgi:hypothetical protein
MKSRIWRKEAKEEMVEEPDKKTIVMVTLIRLGVAQGLLYLFILPPTRFRFLHSTKCKFRSHINKVNLR